MADAGENMGQGETQLVGLQTGAATLEFTVQSAQNVKHRSTI